MTEQEAVEVLNHECGIPAVIPSLAEVRFTVVKWECPTCGRPWTTRYVKGQADGSQADSRGLGWSSVEEAARRVLGVDRTGMARLSIARADANEAERPVATDADQWVVSGCSCGLDLLGPDGERIELEAVELSIAQLIQLTRDGRGHRCSFEDCRDGGDCCSVQGSLRCDS